MRWNSKPKDEFIARGERRTFTEFAWLPTEMDDGTTVWLEKYHEVCFYCIDEDFPRGIWIILSRKIIK